MKKLIMSMAIVAIAGLSLPQMSMASVVNGIVESSQEVKFEEIQQSDLPQAVSDVFATYYTGYTFKKAYKGNDGSYKIVAENGGKDYALIFDQAGELIKKEEKSDKK